MLSVVKRFVLYIYKFNIYFKMINDIKGKKKIDIKDFIGNLKKWILVNLRWRFIDMMCFLRYVYNLFFLFMVCGIVSWEIRNVKMCFGRVKVVYWLELWL